METKRLKNIAILILVLLNAFLLVILGYQGFQSRRVSREMMTEMRALFATENLTLSLPVNALQDSLVPLTLERQTEKESAIAGFLLGEVVPSVSQGGGIYSYSGDAGAVRFRAGGGYDTVDFRRNVGDIDAFIRQFCDKFDYEDVKISIADGSGTVSAMQYVAGVPILGCSVTLIFENGDLVSAVGAHIDLVDAAADGEEHLSCVSALVHFLDHRRSVGIVCSEVVDVRCVYQLHSTATPPRLLPVWEIKTDTYTYMVDGITAVVTRK